MTTATPSLTSEIEIKRIITSTNVRKTFDDTAIKELAGSIKTRGLINPIAVRPSAGRYELIAGERRLRACRLLGMTTIPATVHDVSDSVAMEMQIAENIHRKDLNPIEEARGFKFLLDSRKYTVEDLAKLVDKSIPYVYRAVRLTELPEAIVALIEAGTITPAHGHQILRLPPYQVAAYEIEKDYRGAYPSASDLRDTIDSSMGFSLDHAKFPKNKPYAGTIACTGCQYNSGNQGKLFDGAEKGICSNRPCFDSKDKQHLDDRIEAVKEKYPTAAAVIVMDYAPYPGQKTKGYIVTGELTNKLTKGNAVIMTRDALSFWQASPEKKPTGVVTPAGRAVSPRDGFIRAKCDAAVLAAVAEKCKVYTREVAMAVLNAENGVCDEHFEAIKVKPGADVKKLTLEQIVQLSVLSVIGSSWDIPEAAKTLKVDVTKIIAATTKTAGAEFDAKEAR